MAGDKWFKNLRACRAQGKSGFYAILIFYAATQICMYVCMHTTVYMHTCMHVYTHMRI